jgi:hypothetical protein
MKFIFLIKLVLLDVALVCQQPKLFHTVEPLLSELREELK